MKIKKIKSIQILDSRGNPTIKTTVFLEDGNAGSFSVPSGVSTGKYEALELRDKNGNVKKAIENVEKIIAPKLIGKLAKDQEKIDKMMIQEDGTSNKCNLGTNTILSVSGACAKAAANSLKVPLYQYLAKFFKIPQIWLLPIPLMNFINGGKHAQNSTDFQEYLILPLGAKNFFQAVQMGKKIFHGLKNIIQENKIEFSLGDEGGFGLTLKSNSQPIKILIQAIERAGFQPRKEILIALDPAASEFFYKGVYFLKNEGVTLTTKEMIAFYQTLVNNYPICSIEDGFDQEDWTGFSQLTALLGEKIQIVGDDLYVTNPDRLKKGIQLKATNAILIKPNQIGTLTETVQVIKTAQKAGFQTIISHRSGETDETFIADLAVASNSGQIKTGALGQPERWAKYNRLLEIEKELGNKAKLSPFPYSYS